MIQRFVFKTVAILGLIMAGAMPGMAIDEVTFKSLIEKDKIKLGEKIQYLIVVNYDVTTMTPAVTPPSFAQFNILYENSVIKEQGAGLDRYKVMKKIWLLEPIEIGRLSIASAIITYQDPTSNLLKNGKTDVVFVEVEAPPGAVNEIVAAAADNTTTAKSQGLSFGLIVLIVSGLLIPLAIWLSIRKPAAPRIKPEEVALQSLQSAIDHAEEEDLEKYYVALSRALLDYLQNKFQLDAHVLDTSKLLEKICGYGFKPDVLDSVKDFFQVADKAKFAGYVPDEDEMIVLHGTVKQFVEAGRKLKIKLPKKKKRKKEDE